MTRAKVLQVAASQLDTKESPPGSNKTKYGVWYGIDGQKWCAIFVSWVFNEAGLPLGNIQTKKGIHHCQSAHNYYKSKGMLTGNPSPGDIVIYDWEGNGHADHIGIFIGWANPQKSHIEAWEGNTAQGNDSDGGKVMRRTRSRNMVKSFINPGVYNDAVAPIETVLSNGSRGSDVTVLQNLLYELDYVIEIDGWFGDQTEGFVKDFQTKNQMAATGKVDEMTHGAIQEAARLKRIVKSRFISGSYLRRGNSGIVVTELQKALNSKGANPKLPVTGFFGDLTLKAVKDFQVANHLEKDGIVGSETFKKLGVANV